MVWCVRVGGFGAAKRRGVGSRDVRWQARGAARGVDDCKGKRGIQYQTNACNLNTNRALQLYGTSKIEEGTMVVRRER